MVLNNKYLVLDNDTRYFLFTGGRGSGKSFAISTMLLFLTMEEGLCHTILFTRYTLRAAAISIIPEFKEKIELLNQNHLFHVTKDEIINTQTGSKILFRGIKTSSGDQTANLKSLQGITTWVMDEIEELTDENLFDKIDLSVRQKGQKNRVMLVMNPATKTHWIYQRFFEVTGVQPGSNIIKYNTTYVHTDYKDNKENLSESFLTQIESMKQRRPKSYDHTILGSWLDKAEGVIFNNWEVGEFKAVSKPVFGQDYGWSNDESVLIKTSIDKDNKIIYAQLCFYQAKLTTSEISKLNTKFAGDSLIIGDSSEPRLIHELSKNNNVVPAIKGQGSITYGISLILDYDLIIDPESTNLIEELNNYSWLEKKSKTPIDKYNHCIDALRYAITYQLKNPNLGEYHIW